MPTHVLTGAFYVVDPADLAADAPVRRAGRDRRPSRRRPSEAVDIDEPDELDDGRGPPGRAADPRFRSRTGRSARGPVFVIAEAGVNHEGDVGDRPPAHGCRRRRPERTRSSSRRSEPDALAASGAPTAAYQAAAGEAGGDQRAMLTRLALPDGRLGGAARPRARPRARCSCRRRSTTPRRTCSTRSTSRPSRSGRAS